MQTTNHTPGPWESMGFYISARNGSLPLPNSQTIARVFPEHETVGGNTLANAALIAAAPDLLSALCFLLSDYIAINGDQLTGSSVPIEMARAAISKAEVLK